MVLLANSALMSAGFFMLIPLLSVHLTQDAGFSGAAAGAVLAVRQLTQQGLMVFGGALADRVGYKPVIAAGMLVRAAGFFGFALSDALPVVRLLRWWRRWEARCLKRRGRRRWLRWQRLRSDRGCSH